MNTEKPGPAESNTRAEAAENAREAGFQAVWPHSVSVVIVNFNTGTLLAEVVKSVLSQTAQPLECIIVDNASTDASIDHLRDEVDDERLVILEMDTNLGFAGGCNRGISQSAGAFILLLNPDCFLEPETLERLLRDVASDDKAGAAGPLILNMDGTEQRGCRREIPTPWQIFCVGVGLHRMMPNHPRFRTFNQVGTELPEETVPVQSVSGACVLMKRETVERVGLFDERYFMHFEDLDWCMRVGEADQHVLFVPDAIAHHVGGVSGRDRRLRVEAHKHASLIRFVRSNFAQYYPSAFIALVSLVVYIRWVAVVTRLVLGGRQKGQLGWGTMFVDSDDNSD